MLKKLFTEHPDSVGETYIQHMFVALSFFRTFSYAAFAAFVHAFLPFLHIKTGSGIILELHERMVSKRHEQTSEDQKSGTHSFPEYII